MKWLFVASALTLGSPTSPLGQAEGSGRPRVDPRAPAYSWPAVDMDRDGVFDRVDHCVNTPRGCAVNQFGCHQDSDGDGVCEERDRCPETPRGEKVDALGCHEGARELARLPSTPLGELERKLIEQAEVRLEKVYFETASARLLQESGEALREAGELLEKYPGARVEIQGHTDTRGSASFNLRLSQARAEAVRDYLLVYFEIGSERLIARGYGETRPETDERNEEELLRNRRVVLKVLNPSVLPRLEPVSEDR